MIILTGASACGKTEVAKYLEKNFNIGHVITTTTRGKRVGEENKVDYFFVTKKEFLKLIDQGHFVEHMEYNNNLYGSSIDQIQLYKAVAVDGEGMKAYLKLKDPKIVTFYLETDEMVRFERMLLRGDDKKKALERIDSDRVKYAHPDLKSIDFKINTTEVPVDKVSEYVYQCYIETLKKRKVI